MWVNVWRYDNGRRKSLISLDTARIYVKRQRNPFTGRSYLSHVVAEYPNGKRIVLRHGCLWEAHQVMKAITMAIEGGYQYLDLTQYEGGQRLQKPLQL